MISPRFLTAKPLLTIALACLLNGCAYSGTTGTATGTSKAEGGAGVVSVTKDGECILPPSVREMPPNTVITGEVFLDRVQSGALDPIKDKIAVDAYKSGNEALTSFLVCKAISTGTVKTSDEAEYLRKTLQFLSTQNPTPDQLIAWQSRNSPYSSQGFRLSTREITVSKSNPRSDELIVYNTGDTPLTLFLELSGPFYSPYRKTFLAPRDKVFLTIVWIRSAKETNVPTQVDYDAVLTPDGMAPIPLKIKIVP